MRKTALLFLVLALVAAIAPSALAEPKVSGYFETVINYNIGNDKPYSFGEAYYRINVSGDIDENLAYYSRIEGDSNDTPVIDQAYVTLKNVATPGLNVSIGAVSPWWSRTNNYGTAFGINDLTGVRATYAAGAVGLDSYYQVLTTGTDMKLGSNEEVGAKLGYSTDLSGISLAVDGLVQAKLADESTTGYGVSASVGLDAIGDVYVEYTKNLDDTTSTVVGANVGVLEEATGISAWAEYDVKGKAFAFEASRDIVSGLNLAFGGSKGAGDLATYIKATASVSF